MASSKEYVAFVLEQCNGLSARPMMGEYVLYFGNRVVGGIYDNRVLVKPTRSALSRMPAAPMEQPYEGAKNMLLLDRLDDREFVKELLEAMYEDLPFPKKRKKTERK